MGFSKYLLRQRKVLIAAALIAVVLSALYVNLIAAPVYEASSQIYMVNSQNSIINLSDLQIGSYLTSDYQWVFQTWEIHQMVIDKLDLPYSIHDLMNTVKVTNPGNTRVLVITFTSQSPQEAADIANAYAEVASQYISDTMLTSKPSLISSARVPLSPVRPKKFMIIGSCAAITVLLGAWILFIAYALNDTIKTEDDLYELLKVTPLTSIPYSDKLDRTRFKL